MAGRNPMYVRLFLVLLALMFPQPLFRKREPASTTLDIYIVDVEGGNAVLFVTPSGESVLIDSGNAGAGAVRDAERIVAAAKDAGLTKIDHLITTHYHGDHVGGLAELAARIPISNSSITVPTFNPTRRPTRSCRAVTGSCTPRRNTRS